MTNYQSCQRKKRAKQICRSEGPPAGLLEEWSVLYSHSDPMGKTPVGVAMETKQLAAQRLTHRLVPAHQCLLGTIQMICSEGQRLYWVWLG